MRRDVFQAIADPTRREIIGLLANNPMNLTSVTENFNMSQPAISKHMKILIECGLISVEKQGRERYCEVKLDSLNEVEEWIAPFRKMWEQRFDQLDQLLLTMQSKSKSE
jgi:DNA-binding transcriptional ArsR family regulator